MRIDFFLTGIHYARRALTAMFWVGNNWIQKKPAFSGSELHFFQLKPVFALVLVVEAVPGHAESQLNPMTLQN